MPSEPILVSKEIAERRRGSLGARVLTSCLFTFVSVSFLILSLMMGLQLLRASKMVYGEMRGAPSLALAAGHEIYEGREIQGPLFCVVYAPLTYLLYTPMAWFRQPNSAFLAGSSLALFFYSLPLFYLLLQFRQEPRRSMLAAAAMALLFFVVTLCAAPLAYSSTYVHADAPALGFSGLAACVLFFHHRSNSWTHPLACALLTTFAIATKQNGLPLAAVVPVIALCLGNRRFSVRYLIGVTAFGLAFVAAVAIFSHSLDAVFLNVWTIPTRFPLQWSKAPVVLGVLHESALPLLFTGVAMTIAALAIPSGIAWSGMRPLLVFPAIALAMLPGSLMGMLLVGGDQNALSPFVYFVLLSVLGFLYGSTTGELPVSKYWVGAVLATAGLLVPVAMRELRPFALHQALDRSSSQIAFEYDRRYPGQVYFADHQLSVYLAEGHFYHSDWGVGDYVGAKIPVPQAAVWKYIPEGASYIAYPALAPGYAMLTYLAPHRKMHAIPDLPGFEVFEIER
jgi:hypothetical protein